MRPVADSCIGSDTYTFQVLPWPSSRLNIVSASLLVSHFWAGLFTVKPDDVAAVQKDRFMKVWDGTSQNQWSNTPKPRANPLSTGTCAGVYAVMICEYSL
jgi:hypothetical protein